MNRIPNGDHDLAQNTVVHVIPPETDQRSDRSVHLTNIASVAPPAWQITDPTATTIRVSAAEFRCTQFVTCRSSKVVDKLFDDLEQFIESFDPRAVTAFRNPIDPASFAIVMVDIPRICQDTAVINSMLHSNHVYIQLVDDHGLPCEEITFPELLEHGWPEKDLALPYLFKVK